MTNELRYSYFGTLPFAEARALQEEQIVAVQAGAPEVVLYGEHTPTLTFGNRGSWDDVYCEEQELARRGIAVANASRGGQVTFHNPGQLVVYPVLSLRARGLGVKRYVSLLLVAAKETCNEFGIDTAIDICSTGLWVGAGESRKKIAAVGIRVQQGVSNHGLSLNVCNELEPYSLFSPCGQGVGSVTSLTEVSGQELLVSDVASVYHRHFCEQLVTKVTVLPENSLNSVVNSVDYQGEGKYDRAGIATGI